ncbi:MAG: hypothetical protein QOE72_1483 [Chloroflexota bacterium]|jgi:hypothetical protein|nr:hypothetical protein [Chloroflexota bacterium]
MLSTSLAVGGSFWGRRGFPDAFLDETLEIDTRREHAVFTPWIASDHRLTLDVGPERVTLETRGGETVESRTEPRSAFPRYERDVFLFGQSPWDRLELGYFLGYAMWTYLTAPFLFTYGGVETREIEPWQENGETWRRLEVTFPSTLATHNRVQTYYYDAEGMQRRMDYAPDVAGNPPVAQYTSEPKRFGGIVFPTHRRVHRRDADGIADLSFFTISIDIHDVIVQ